MKIQVCTHVNDFRYRHQPCQVDADRYVERKSDVKVLEYEHISVCVSLYPTFELNYNGDIRGNQSLLPALVSPVS